MTVCPPRLPCHVSVVSCGYHDASILLSEFSSRSRPPSLTFPSSNHSVTIRPHRRSLFLSRRVTNIETNQKDMFPITVGDKQTETTFGPNFSSVVTTLWYALFLLYIFASLDTQMSFLRRLGDGLKRLRSGTTVTNLVGKASPIRPRPDLEFLLYQKKRLPWWVNWTYGLLGLNIIFTCVLLSSRSIRFA